jgi:hypothetical protein
VNIDIYDKLPDFFIDHILQLELEVSVEE